jgi:hypothetical protein
MTRQYVPYWLWEDYLNSMWNKLDKNLESEMLQKAIEFTGNWKIYGEAMGQVIIAWPNTMKNSLTNISINRRAFLGHCACSYAFNCPEYITRQAWHNLSLQQQIDADKIAQAHINNYEKQDRKIHSRLGKQMLFEWHSR